MSLVHEPVHAPRGPQLSCKGWGQEAALRMLMNNLDPEVAEHPDQLVVYGGTGKAARTGRPSTPSSRRCRARGRRDAARPVGQAGRRVPDPRVGAARADRQLQPGAATGPTGRSSGGSSARPDHVRPDDGRLLDLHRHAGHPAGHLRDLRRDRRRRFGGTLAGTITLTAGLGGMGGAQPLAVTMNGGVAICIEVDPSPGSSAGSSTATSTSSRDLDDAIRRAVEAATRVGRCPSACSATPPR